MLWLDGYRLEGTVAPFDLRDRGLLPCLLDGLETLIPDYQLVPIRDAGHFLPWEAPDEVTTALLEWLDRRVA